MSSASSQSNSSSTVPAFNAENISEQLGIRTQPATAIAELDGWDEVKAGLEEGRDWEEIDGVGPQTAETLDMISSPQTIASPESAVESPEPSVEPASSEQDEAGDEEAESDEEGESEGETDDDEAPDSEGADEVEGEADDNPEGQAQDDASEEPDGEDADEEVPLSEVKTIPSVFEATIEKSRVGPFFKAVNRVVDESKVRIGEDGLNVRAVDPANVQMVDGDLSEVAFESYNAEKGVIGVNLDRLNQILGNANKGDLVHFELDTQTRKLTISIENLEFTMALIDPDSIRQEPDLPDLDLDAKIIMQGNVFTDAIKAVDMVTDHAQFHYDHDSAEVFGEGDVDDATIDFTDEDDVHEISSHEKGRSIFSLDYLKNFKRMVDKDTTITLRVGHEFPLMVNFGLADGHVQIDGMLAPRIQSD